MPSLLAVAVVSLAFYYVLVELPSPTFVVHDQGLIILDLFQSQHWPDVNDEGALVISGASSGIGLDAAIHIAAKGLLSFPF